MSVIRRILQLESQNKFHDCATIKLHRQSKFNFLNFINLWKPTHKFELELTFRFGEHTFEHPQTKKFITFAIEAAEVILELDNMIMPMETWNLGQPFQVKVEVNRGVEEEQTKEGKWKLGWKKLFFLIR